MALESTIADRLFNRDFIQTRMTQIIASNMNVTKFTDRQQIGDDVANYVYFEEKETPEEDRASGKTKAPQKIAPGAELQIVRMSDLKATPAPLETRGFKLILEAAKLKQNGQSVLRFMQRMAYNMAYELEGDSIAAFGQGTATPATISTAWSTSTNINKDLRAMDAAYLDDSLALSANTKLMDKTNYTELCDFKEDTEGKNYGFPSFSEGDQQYVYGGGRMTHGTILNFDRNTPLATTAYAVNPRAFNPKVMKGMEDFAPYINVKVKEVYDEDPEKLIIFMRMTTTSVLEEPKGVQVQTGA